MGVSPTLVTGKVTSDGTDVPGYTLTFSSISYSTHKYDTDMTKSLTKSESQAASLSDGVPSSSFAKTMAGAWGSSADAVIQQINAGIAVANQLYPAPTGQPFAVLASGGNIMRGHGGYIQVVFGGSVNMVFMIGYGADGKIGAILQYSGTRKASSSPMASSAPIPPVQTSNIVSSPPRQQGPLVFHYEQAQDTNGRPVYIMKVVGPTPSTSINPESVTQTSVLLQLIPAPLAAMLVAACIAVFRRRSG